MMVGVLLIVKIVLHVDQKYRRENIKMSRRMKIGTVCLGIVVGFIIGLTSVGSGTLIGVFLILFYPLTTDRIVGTDVFQAMILLLATGLAQIGVGNVDLLDGRVAAHGLDPRGAPRLAAHGQRADTRAARHPRGRALPERAGAAVQGVAVGRAPRSREARLVPFTERREPAARDHGGRLMFEFLTLPERTSKPRESGLTHVLDKGFSLEQVRQFLEVAGELRGHRQARLGHRRA